MVHPMGPARTRVRDAVRSAGGPIAVEDIAAAVRLSLNAVRHHLAALEADGLVVSDVERGGQRGRPRRVFTPGPGAGGPYEQLALTLLHAHRTGESLEAAAAVTAPPGDDVVAFLAAEGFDPRPAEDGSVLLAACPLARAAAADAAAVCGVHRVLVAAIGARRGQHVELIAGRPGTCRVTTSAAESCGPAPSPARSRAGHGRGRDHVQPVTSGLSSP